MKGAEFVDRPQRAAARDRKADFAAIVYRSSCRLEV
jgi:hypothetical protein